MTVGELFVWISCYAGLDGREWPRADTHRDKALVKKQTIVFPNMRIDFMLSMTAVAAMLASPWVAAAVESVPNTYLTISRYERAKLVQDDPHDDIALNSVLQVPTWNRMCVSVMREVAAARPEWDIPKPTQDCDRHLRDFLWQNREVITSLWSQNKFNGDDDVDGFYPTVFVARLNGKGKVGVVARNWTGGSGGAEIAWAIYTISDDEGHHFSFPARPAYEGTEFHPGGSVWSQAYCTGNETFLQCARRQLFSLQHACKLVFADDGVRSEAVKETEELPLEERE